MKKFLSTDENGDQAERSQSKTDGVFNGKNERVLGHLTSMGQKPCTGVPVEQEQTDYPETMGIGIKHVKFWTVDVERKNEDG